MIASLTCKYCNYSWQDTFYNEMSVKNQRCEKCGDKDLKVRDYKDEIVDYYVGCTPFPEKEIDIKEDSFNELYQMWSGE